MSGVVYWLDMAGVIVFALSGVVLACRSRMDPFGMLVLAAVTGIGGGTLRDLVLGIRPVFWVSDPTYLWVILATVAVSLLGFHYIHRLSRGFLPVADALGLALFVVIGTHKALLLGTSGVVAVVMGVMTGVAGGMLRDVLAHRVPMVLREEIYATAAIAGGSAYVVLHTLGAPLPVVIAASLVTTLGLRLAAIHWRLALPVFAWVSVAPPPPEEGSEALSTPAKAKERVRMIRQARKR
ncbi:MULTISPECIES: trimeric intracellular cation channel family protein [unclassified Halomonas]|uniref:trimeric intracellular cation channel family protein n=1 Tax=unclassified Halomonas TaxID=2609666 RepID=UPI0020A1E97D|nr:trimeric intracellular cation channel family protein [Halomonas sp. 707D7]MCP1325753.1 trimeric intracellular cation channel family protein [Halomonas sp. 707D4]